jgi:predicted phage terminase large subunit-like protein
MLKSSNDLSESALLQELLSRNRARQTLQGFTSYTTPKWVPGKIHRVVCEQLDRVVRGEIDRLMLLCPPQHGKSHITSRRFPGHILGRDPTKEVIAASATADLAEGFGRDVRNCIASPEYRNIYPATMLAEDSQAKGKWNTKQGGGYTAVGVGGQLYGKGGMGIIDDPFGSWKDAQSERSRDDVWDWYQGTFYNRIRPGEPIIVIQHRMHEDDLSGRLIERQKTGGDKWEIVELPALLEDPPWIERYDRKALERIRDNSDPRQWAALYLQNPAPDEGTFFKREWFGFYKTPPDRLHKYTTGDFAVTEGDGDFTDIGTHGYAPDGVLYLGLDGWYGQTSADKWIEALIDQYARHKPYASFAEMGVIRRSIEPFLVRRMRERKVYCRLEWLATNADKSAMARPLQAMASMGRVKLPDNEYGYRLLNQLLSFPAGKFDDAVDMASLMARAIDQAHPAIAASINTAVQPKDSWSKVFDSPESKSWRTA